MKVFFVQHGLKNYSGHYLLATRAWRNAVLSAGLEWRGYAHQALPVSLATALDVVPLFPYVPYLDVDPDPLSREITDLLYLSEQFANALSLLTDAGPEDLVVVDFASEREIYGMARWVRQLPADRRPKVAFLVHIPDANWTTDADRRDLTGRIAHWRFSINQLRASLPVSNIFVAAIDSRLAGFLTTILDLTTHVTPLVSMFEPDLAELPLTPEHDVLLAGGWRSEKGTNILADILLGLKRSGRALRVAVQVDSEERKQDILGPFMESGPFLLDVTVGSLSPADYLRRLCKTRLILLPYVAKMYALRGSGIAAEAFTYGIPVVAPAKTWMADRIEDRSGAGALFYQWHPLSIVATTLRALDEMTRLTEEARTRAPRWRERNCADAALRGVRTALEI